MAELFDQDKLEIVNAVVEKRYDLNYDQRVPHFGFKIAIMLFGYVFVVAAEHFKIFNSTVRSIIGAGFVGIGFLWLIIGYFDVVPGKSSFWVTTLEDKNNAVYDNYGEKAKVILQKLRLYDLLYTVSLMQPVPGDVLRAKRDLYNLLVFDFVIGKEDETNAIVHKYKYLFVLADEVANNYSDKAWSKYMAGIKNMRNDLLDVGDSKINAICAKLGASGDCESLLKSLNK